MNVKEEREKAGITQEKLALETGIPRDRIAKWEQGKGSPKADDFQTLEKFFREFKPDGIGNMFPVEQVPTAQQKSIRKPKIDSNPYLVPFVDVPAQAGYTKAYSNVDYIATLKHFPILPDVDPTGATWRYFQIEGDSMEGEIRAGDTILASLVIREDWNDLRDFYTYVIVTDEELLIKDVLKETDSTWILLSQNELYKPRRINVEEIRQLWVMRRHVRNRANKTRMYDVKEIKKQLK